MAQAVRANAYHRGAASDALAPETFVHDIDVPVFLAGAWQDQETGSHFANMLGNFSPDIPMKITLMNGLHQDSLGPAVLSQWAEFLDFYVAKKIPSIPPTTRALASLLLGRIFGKGATLAPDRFTGQTDYATALRTYESEPRVRVLFDVGADKTPMPTFSTTATDLPAPGHHRRPRGTWATTARSPTHHPPVDGADRFRYDPSAFPRTMTTERRRRHHAHATAGSRCPRARRSAT